MLKPILTHWNIGNYYHWVLDIAFYEDESRIYRDREPEDYVVLQYLALKSLKVLSANSDRPQSLYR